MTRTLLDRDWLKDLDRQVLRQFVGWPKVEFEPDEIAAAYAKAKRWNDGNQKRGVHDNRYDVTRGSQEIHMIGALGELAYALWSGEQTGRAYGASDFRDGTDVKATTYGVPNLLVVDGKKAPRWRYVSVKVAESHRVAFLAGWISVGRWRDVRIKSRLQRGGRSGWFVPYHKLTPMEDGKT